jgi:small subunit ribosomal protein S17
LERGKRKIRAGIVVSDKMDKTISVAIESYHKHPLYKKILKKIKKLKADDPGSECKVGDIVKIVETRPLSKTKRWRVLEVVKKAPKF